MKELPKGTKIYQCEHCNKVSISKGAMVRHEICCRRNPSNHTPCASCEYLEKKSVIVLDYYNACGYYDVALPITEDEDGKEISESEFKEIMNRPFAMTRSSRWYHRKTVMFCTKKNLKLYHNKVNRFGVDKAKLIISQCDAQMPTECEDCASIYE